MIFISKENLCVIETGTELDAIDRGELIRPLLERPGNIVYFETAGRLYGLITTGDVFRSKGSTVRINKQYTCFRRDEPMLARKAFFANRRLSEIPVVADGRLVGEFQSCDDELYLDTALPLSRNAYAGGYFAAAKAFALVVPSPAHRYKQKYFEHMKAILDGFHARYTVLTPEEMIKRFDDFEQFLMVDAPEKKGAVLVLYLLRGMKYFQRILTYCELFGRLESAEVMDYEETYQELKSLGLGMVFLTAAKKGSAYRERTEKALRGRFPTEFPENLNDLARPYAEEFFDDLYALDGYAETLLHNSFLVEKDQRNLRLRDYKSRYINVSMGSRVTVGQPEEYERTIYFFGACLTIGNYVGDAYTIESWLQKRINDSGRKVRVENCGCWGGRMMTLGRMVSTRFRKGDVIVCLQEGEEFQVDGASRLDLWDILEEHRVPAEWMLDNPYHVNHHVTKMYADRLFDEIFRDEDTADGGTGAIIPYHYDMIDKFFVRKYFYNIDLSGYRTAACLVFHANPFTNGHRWLVEAALRETEHVYLLILQAEASMFSYYERYAMAVAAIGDLPNVTVLPSGLFIGNAASFSGYYAKMYTPDTIERCRDQAISYARVAKSLHVTHRFLGEEPTDPITLEINRTCLEILPEYGIKTVILPRKAYGGELLTGSRVRALAETDPDRLEECVAGSTADIILCRGNSAF